MGRPRVKSKTWALGSMGCMCPVGDPRRPSEGGCMCRDNGLQGPQLATSPAPQRGDVCGGITDCGITYGRPSGHCRMSYSGGDKSPRHLLSCGSGCGARNSELPTNPSPLLGTAGGLFRPSEEGCMWGGIGPGVVSSCMGDYCLTGSSPGTEERANKTKSCMDLVVRTNGYKRLPGDKFPPREAESVRTPPELGEEAYRQGGHEGPVREEFSLEGVVSTGVRDNSEPELDALGSVMGFPQIFFC